MKQPYRAMVWTVLPYAAWTVWALIWWMEPTGGGDHAGLARLAPLVVSALLGLPCSLLFALLGWTVGVHTDDGLFACVLLGGWAQYLTLGWFVGRGIVRQRVLDSLKLPDVPDAPGRSESPAPPDR